MKNLLKRLKNFSANKPLIIPKITSKIVNWIIKKLKPNGRLVMVFYNRDVSHKFESRYADQNYSDFAICLQGPCADPEFVDRSLAFYHDAFPGVEVFYGTNGNYDSDLAKVFHLPDPNHGGYGNFNNQRQCTIIALKQAFLAKKKFALKMRDDLLIRNPNSLRYLEALSSFHTKGKTKRVLISSLHSRFHIPFHLCDFAQFGETRHLLGIWNATTYQDYTLNKKEYVDLMYKNTPIYDSEAKVVRPHVELGFGALRYFLKKSPSKQFEQAWKEWMGLFYRNIGFFDLDDIGVIVDKYDSTLRFHRDIEETIYHQATTEIWLSILASRMATGQDFTAIFRPEDLY
jgi:hypothetical protein